ncbi:MAG TPA: hypothetical protein VFL36_03750 [Myxococcales bacterium]|nr:hypothetical protein [Myxococcales bacterium]
MIRWILIGAVSLWPLAAAAQNTSEGRADSPQRGSSPTPMDANHAPPTSQRGSRGSTAGGAERTGTPGAGIESGDANGMAGGRTDEGPRGGTGIRGTLRGRHARARARANSQARGRNPKGSLERPAETPPQIELNPRPMGSGAPMTPVDQEPQPQGRNYPEGPQPGAAGGIASGTEGSPGGAAVEGTAGKGAQVQPDEKAGGKQEGGHDPK